MLINNYLYGAPRLIAMTVLVLLLGGCDWLPFGYTTIKEITAAPANYEGKEVKLKGNARGVTKLPMLDLKTYTLHDEAGEISVTTRGTLPAENEQVALRGTVKSAVIIGGRSLGLRIEEIRRF